MADNRDKRVLKSSIEREQSQTCLNSAEREKIKGSTNLNVPHLRFPEFRGEWEKHTIGELCEEFKSGKNIKAENIQEGGVYPVFGGNGLRGYADRYNHEGDYVLIGRQGALCGNVRFVTGKTYITEHAIAAKATNNNYTRFLEYLFVRLNLGQFSDQSAQPGLAVNKLLKIETFVPSKEEQYKIASLLKFLDERIATQNKIIEELESLIKGLYDKVLWQSNKQTSLSEILVERNERTTINNQYQVLSSTAKGLYRQSDYFDKEVASANNIGYKVLRLGDIVLSPQNLWLGNINYNDLFEIGIVSPSYKVFSIRNSYNPYYVSCFLKTPKALYEYTNASEQGASVVRRNLDNNAFMAICFPMPNKILQDKTSERLRKINMKLDIEKQIHERLNVQKQYLLRHMFI